jgi:FkbM family methyltransferase
MNTKIQDWENRLTDMIKDSVDCIASFLPDDYTFIDVGSNTGLLTKMILDIKPNYKSIHMFEPIPEYYDECVSKFDKYDNITINNIGIGDKKESLKIKIDNDNLGYNKIEEDGSFDINLITFTEYAELNKINDVDFIKIDTEGYDIKVMQGMYEWLSKRTKLPYIYFEKGWDLYAEQKHCEHMIKELGYKEVIEYSNDFILIP